MCAALRKHTGALRGFSLKGGPNLWLKDIDPKLREKETLRKIQDLQLSCLTQEYLFRRLVSHEMPSEAKMYRLHLVFWSTIPDMLPA